MLPNCLDVDGHSDKLAEEGFVLDEQPEQKVLRLYLGRAELAGFVPCEEDGPPGRFVIELEQGVDARSLRRSNDRR